MKGTIVLNHTRNSSSKWQAAGQQIGRRKVKKLKITCQVPSPSGWTEVITSLYSSYSSSFFLFFFFSSSFFMHGFCVKQSASNALPGGTEIDLERV